MNPTNKMTITRRSFMQRAATGVGLFAVGGIAHGAGPKGETLSGRICGCLRRHSKNGRYFTDDGGRAIYLTGSHFGWK
ncbi:MAG: twin-arginine translocation signal domain-containing protein [Pirellulaceae bacterium]|nr:twin-arginine translocation signal domain-containing protein [Pirellulaceae bacterium]